MKKIRLHTRSGFTLVELIIGMTIFSMGMTAIFLLLQSTMSNMVYSRNETVVANLLREELELVRNMRDSNISNYTSWDKIPSGVWQEGIYTIENEFNNDRVIFDNDGKITSAPIKITPISTFSVADVNDFSNEKLKEKFKKTQLFLDDQKRYTHTQTSTGTIFASYLVVRALNYGDGEIQKETEDENGTRVQKSQGFIFDARIIVRSGAHYREYDGHTLLTDWIK